MIAFEVITIIQIGIIGGLFIKNKQQKKESENTNLLNKNLIVDNTTLKDTIALNNLREKQLRIELSKLNKKVVNQKKEIQTFKTK